MSRRSWTALIVIVFLFLAGLVFVVGGAAVSLFGGPSQVVRKDSVLHLKLEGIILEARNLLKELNEYGSHEHIKAVVLEINSPGGAVAPSQELFAEFQRFREESQKPVVVYCSSLTASGGYYVAAAADKIVTSPGSLLGSIGVIMEFANLKELYQWAKIDRYAIYSGEYKIAGSTIRPMQEDEKRLFQELVNEVHEQFKAAVADGRGLKPETVDKYGDGRVFTGEQAVEWGFADQTGTFEEATRLAGELAGIEGDPTLFVPPKSRRDLLMEWLFREDEDFQGMTKEDVARGLGAHLLGQPLYLMPGIWPEQNR